MQAAALFPGHILQLDALESVNGPIRHSKDSCDFAWVHQQVLAALPHCYAPRVRHRLEYSRPFSTPKRGSGTNYARAGKLCAREGADAA